MTTADTYELRTFGVLGKVQTFSSATKAAAAYNRMRDRKRGFFTLSWFIGPSVHAKPGYNAHTSRTPKQQRELVRSL